MKKGMVLFFLILAALMQVSCWKKQDIAVNPPLQPTYTLFGTITNSETGLPIISAKIKVTMTQLYQGEFIDPLEALTDSSGYYEIQGLYRGRYSVRVTRGYDWLFDGEVGIIQYEDKLYDLSLKLP